MKAIIFANGIMQNLPSSIKPMEKENLIIAADGGLKYCMKFEIMPDIVVGDMDSINHSQLSKMETLGVELIKHPVRKDETDLELALKVALNKGANDIIILGAMGGRWDMTFCNVLILAADYLKNTNVKLINDNLEIICINSNKKIYLRNREKFKLSILPISETVQGITMRGMEYQLENENLELASTRGLSNIITDNNAFIQINKGQLIVMIQE